MLNSKTLLYMNNVLKFRLIDIYLPHYCEVDVANGDYNGRKTNDRLGSLV